MKKLAQVTTETFEVESDYFKGFRIDIVSNEAAHEFEAWLYHESIGIKELLWGVDSNTETFDSFMDAVKSGADDQIMFYLKEHVDF